MRDIKNVGLLSAAWCWALLPRFPPSSSGWYSPCQCTVSPLLLLLLFFWKNKIWYLGLIVKLGLIWCLNLIGFLWNLVIGFWYEWSLFFFFFVVIILWFLIICCKWFYFTFCFGAENFHIIVKPRSVTWLTGNFSVCLIFFFSILVFYVKAWLSFYIKKSIMHAFYLFGYILNIECVWYYWQSGDFRLGGKLKGQC